MFCIDIVYNLSIQNTDICEWSNIMNKARKHKSKWLIVSIKLLRNEREDRNAAARFMRYFYKLGFDKCDLGYIKFCGDIKDAEEIKKDIINKAPSGCDLLFLPISDNDFDNITTAKKTKNGDSVVSGRQWS